ncbi:hypothetical protein FCM35_KLT09982 [Carex littledalei]|uniref:Uncharacterized protein n=1 Tax=Carex littledalei TaxID=544730 RepID=A0A833RUV3_9POAL|nr:hypothetical protein FCM35_KLT09982 [Carex littledalei]
MRQFGFSQPISVAPPLGEDEVRRLHHIIHSVHVTRKDWAAEHHTYVEQASHPADHLVAPTGLWSDDQLFAYRTWFQNNCMHNVFLSRRCIQDLDHPIPEYRDEHNEALRGVKMVSYGIACAKIKTLKKVRKFFLRLSCGLLRDNGMEPKYHDMMRAADLPVNYEDIPDGDIPPGQEPIPDVPADDDPHYRENWLNSNDGLMNYLARVVPPQVDPGQTCCMYVRHRTSRLLSHAPSRRSL